MTTDIWPPPPDECEYCGAKKSDPDMIDRFGDPALWASYFYNQNPKAGDPTFTVCPACQESMDWVEKHKDD